MGGGSPSPPVACPGVKPGIRGGLMSWFQPSPADGSQEAGMAVPIFAGGAVAVHRLRRPLPGTAAAGKGGPHRGAGGAARGEELPMKKSVIRWPDRTRLDDDAGMTTAEYAVGTLAACTFAIVLLAVVKSGSIESGLSDVILEALGIR